ncbi:MAG TPA: hypothetical protein VN366_03630 [Feifaniaceae bacterium]|nr:hypothetical protein [Feifaniaceae bacterium]
MRVTFSNIGQSNFLNIHGVHQSIAIRNGSGGSLQSIKAEGRDIVTISLQGRAKSLLQNLMKQKTDITEQKNALVSKTLEEGGTLDSIEPQLEAYEELVKMIDQQIAETMAKEIEKQAEKRKPKGDHKPKTEEETQNARLANISSLSGDLQQAKIASSVKTKVDGESRILKSEIEFDKAYAALSKGALKAKVENKVDELADMEQKSLRLASQIADKLADISGKAADSSTQEAGPETENGSIGDKQSVAARPMS